MHQLVPNIDRALLSRVMGNATRRRSAGGGSSAAVVSAAVLAETARTNRNCHCEDHGLKAGMLVEDLIELESGCTGLPTGPGWVCPRLDAVRRKYGK